MQSSYAILHIQSTNKAGVIVAILMKVSTNGFISLGGEFITDSFDVRPFSSIDLPYPMIAPLWADFNFREEGAIFYRVTNDSSVLIEVAKRVANHNSNYTDYVPREAVIITWFQSRLFEGEYMVS